MATSLDLVQLRTFVTIARCGGFGRAASALFISQPTVSQHVRLLERRLGTALVEKDGRNARLTPAGQRLLLEASRILSVHDDALERLEAIGPRQLTIGSSETTSDQVLPELLAVLGSAYPDYEVRFHIDRSTRIAEEVLKGRIDLAIVLDVNTTIPGVDVGQLPLRWYSAPGFRLPGPEDPWPIVAYTEPCGMRQVALSTLTDLHRSVVVTAESGTLEGVLAATRAGLGIAVLPSSRTGTAPAGLVQRDDLPPLGSVAIQLLTRRGLDDEVASVAAAALRRFFDSERHGAGSFGLTPAELRSGLGRT